jgi:hypothetical protein
VQLKTGARFGQVSGQILRRKTVLQPPCATGAATFLQLLGARGECRNKRYQSMAYMLRVAPWRESRAGRNGKKTGLSEALPVVTLFEVTG